MHKVVKGWRFAALLYGVLENGQEEIKVRGIERGKCACGEC